MLGKLAVLCLCLALASAKPASRVKSSPKHFGLVKTCDVDAIVSSAQTIAQLSTTFAENLMEEVAEIQSGVTLCSDPIDALLCLSKGIKEIMVNSELIVKNVKNFVNKVPAQVSTLSSEIKACL